MNPEAAAPSAPADQQDTLVMQPDGSPEQPTLVMSPPEPTTGSEPTTPTNQPETDEKLVRNLKINVVDASHGVIGESADYADKYLAEQTTQHGFKGFIKKIWHGNIARDYVRLRKVQEGRQIITQSGNLGKLRDDSQHDHNQAMSAVVERFTDDYLHGDEHKEKLSDTQAGETLESELRTLVNFYASGAIGSEELEEHKTRIMDSYKKQLHDQDRNKGLIMADNVIEVAENARAAFKHGVGMDRIQAALEANFGEARVGQRTEARRELTDKIVDKLYSHKLGSLVNETSLAVAAGIAITAAKLTARKATTAAAATVSMGVGAGLVAGAREHARIGQERQQHIRERAVGQDAPESDAKRRVKLEETRYNTVSAVSLADQLSEAREAVNSAEPLSIQSIVQSISEIEARIKLSDEHAADLIDYSSSTNLEQERLRLDISLAEAKVFAKRSLENADETSLQGAGLTNDLDSMLASRFEGASQALIGEMSAKDAAFSKLRRTQTLKMAGIGLVSGLVVGDAIQEARAAFSDSLQGVFEGNNGHVDRQTLLAGLLGHHANNINTSHTMNVHEVALGKEGKLDLPADYHVKEVSPGHWNLLGADGQPVADNLTTGPHGHLTEASQEALRNAGFHMHEQVQHSTTHHLETKTIHSTPHEFLEKHPGNFTKVHRELWYDNNTPDTFDQNELKLWWGGANNTGVDAHGNFVFNVSQMTQDGSFHDGLSADAHHLIHEGKMAIALSMTHDTQAHVVMIPIDEHGNAIIKANSWMAHSMFEMKDGQAHFSGAYAEAVQLMGKHNGIESMRMLATEVGSGDPKRIQDVVNHLVATHHEHTLTHITGGPEHFNHTPVPVEIAPVLPIYARRGLEKGEKVREMSNPNLNPMYYGGKSLEELQDWITQDPSRLRTRREVIGENGNTKWVEADGSEVVRDVERERHELIKYLEKERSINPSHFTMVEKTANALGPMSETNRVSVNVPAWMEEGNLRNFLEQYIAQMDNDGHEISADVYEVNILVNRKTGTAPDKSIEVIENFINDFKSEHGFKPSIKYSDIELDPPYNNVGYARKLLTDAVCLRSIERKKQEKALYFETEDADMVTIDRKTVSNLIDKLDSNPELDAARGIQDRTPGYMKDNDYLFLRRRAWDFFEINARSKRYRDPQNPKWNFTWNRVVTGGWNTGYSAEAYALIDGYEVVEAGEDMSVGEKITMVRGDGKLPNLEVVGTTSTRSNSSPRRFIHEILIDEPAYGDFSNEEVNKIIRDKSVEEALKTISRFERINSTNEAEFGSYVSNIHSWAQTSTPNKSEANELTKRILFFLGFKDEDYELTDAGLRVLSWDNIKSALDGYRQRYDPAISKAPIAST